MTGARIKVGGSTRRKGEDDVRRFERRPTRLCLGDPRLWLIGVALVVAGRDTDRVEFLRFSDSVGIEVNIDKLGLGLEGAASVRMKLDAFRGVPSLFFERLVGELKIEGSTFSESNPSSKTDGE